MSDLTPEERRDLLTKAPSYQGGHSAEGWTISQCLGVPFPIKMPALEAHAKAHGFEPFDLWPWLKELRAPPRKDTPND